MDDREDEMVALQQELEAKIHDLEDSNAGTPFIERPEHMDVAPGMLCWMDGTRCCGPDCVGYNTEMIDPETQELLQGPNKCLPMLYMGQQGAAALSTLLVNRKRVTQVQDERRAQQERDHPVPDPFGRSK